MFYHVLNYFDFFKCTYLSNIVFKYFQICLPLTNANFTPINMIYQFVLQTKLEFIMNLKNINKLFFFCQS